MQSHGDYSNQRVKSESVSSKQWLNNTKNDSSTRAHIHSVHASVFALACRNEWAAVCAMVDALNYKHCS